MDSSPLCVLTVHAHPDDEASKGAATVARYVAQGVRAVLVCCTGGEEGDLQNPALSEPGQPFHGLDTDAVRALLAQLRPVELQRSAAAIGYHHTVMLGYRDSGMADSPANEHPDCFHQADLDEAVGRLVEVIRRERPHVIITYGDDQRGYPHPDHLKVHDISMPAFDRAGDATWRPDLGPAWQPLKMYFTVWPKARLMAVHEAMLQLNGTSPFEQAWLDRAGHDHRVTTKVHVAEFLGARSAALRAHATQVDPAQPFWFGLTDEQLAEVYPWEDWQLAGSHVGFPETGQLEEDLFVGVREHSATGTSAVQIRLSVGRSDVRVDGPADADVVVTLNLADATLDPTVAFMTGKLKSTGPTGPLLAVLSDGTIAAAIKRLASQP